MSAHAFQQPRFVDLGFVPMDLVIKFATDAGLDPDATVAKVLREGGGWAEFGLDGRCIGVESY